MRTIAPVVNLATVLALCVVCIGAWMRGSGRRPGAWRQFCGGLLVIAGTGLNMWLDFLLRAQSLRPTVAVSPVDADHLVWLLGWMMTTVGFIIFAWGYMEETMESPRRAR